MQTQRKRERTRSLIHRWKVKPLIEETVVQMAGDKVVSNKEFDRQSKFSQRKLKEAKLPVDS